MRFLTTDPFPFASSPVPAVVAIDDDAVPPQAAGLVPLDPVAAAALARSKASYLQRLDFNRACQGLTPLSEAERADLLAVPEIAPEPQSPARVFDMRRSSLERERRSRKAR